MRNIYLFVGALTLAVMAFLLTAMILAPVYELTLS